MKSSTGFWRAAVYLAFLAPVLCGCSFDLKNPEAPSMNESDDPFFIVDILKQVDRNVMTDMVYSDYFTSNIDFVDYRLFKLLGRDVIQMLERLRSQSSRSLRVEWQFDRANKWPDGDLYHLNGVSYTVYIDGAPQHRGTADFRILISSSRITYWKDMPDGEPFFFQPKAALRADTRHVGAAFGGALMRYAPAGDRRPRGRPKPPRYSARRYRTVVPFV